MPAKPVTLAQRVDQYAAETMYVFDKNKKLMGCAACDCRVEWSKKSTIDVHVNSSTHKENKKAHLSEGGKRKRQVSMGDALSQAERLKADKEEFVTSTVKAFLAANIPLKKLGEPHMKKWMRKYVKGQGNLPSVYWIRKHIIPKIKQQEETNWKEELKDKDISILCDETTDRRGKAVFLTLFKIFPKNSSDAPKLMVAGVSELETVNSTTTAQTLIQVCGKYGVKYSNVKVVVTDSARYMTACVRKFKGIVGSHIIHVQCWDHKLEKLEKVFCDKLKRLNNFVKNTKKLFKNTRKRKHLYLSFLKNKYPGANPVKKAVHFPIPVMSRWTSWVKSVRYCNVYKTDIFEYAKTLSKDDGDKIAQALKYFKDLTDEDLAILGAEAAFVTEHCSDVSDLIIDLEGSKYPMSHRLLPLLDKVRTSFTLLQDFSDISVLGEQTQAALLSLSEQKKKNVESRFQDVATACVERLKTFIDNDPAKEFFSSAAELFSPLKIVSANVESVAKAYKTVDFLKCIPLAQFQILHGVLREEVKLAVNKNPSEKKKDFVYDVLTGMLGTENSSFASKCLNTIFVPVSNVDCERGFSNYNDVVTAKRCKFLTENVEVAMQLHFGDESCDDENGNIIEHLDHDDMDNTSGSDIDYI